MNMEETMAMAMEMAQKEVKKMNKKISTVKKVWFMFEIFQMIVFVMGSIMLLWLYAPYSMLAKMAITTLMGIIVLDVYRSFVHVRWILLKEGN